MDDRAIRAARRCRLASMLTTLEMDGGDELAVLEGLADGMIAGLATHGPLDLEAPRDWQREIDQEERDRTFYGACKREADRRADERALREAGVETREPDATGAFDHLSDEGA